MGYFKKPPSAWLGLDIGSTAVKLVSANKTNFGIRLQDHAIAYLNPPISPKGELSQAHMASLTCAIQTIAASIPKSLRKQVIAALPDTQIFTQEVTPNPEIADPEAAILLAAAPNIPQPIDQIIFDFSPDINANKNVSKILTVACLKSDLHRYLQPIQTAGLKLHIIEPASHALERAYRYYYRLDLLSHWVLIEVGMYHFTILTWQQEHVIGADSIVLNYPNLPHLVWTQIQQTLAIRLLTHAISQLEMVHFIGGHPQLQSIVSFCQHLFSVGYPIVKHPQRIPSPEYLTHFSLAAGLALRGDE